MERRLFTLLPLSVLLVTLCCLSCSGHASEDYRFEAVSHEDEGWKHDAGGGFFDAEQVVKAKIRALKARYLPNEGDVDDVFFPATCKQYTRCLQFNDVCAKCNDNDNVTCDKICTFPYDCSSSRDVNICVDTLINMECNDTSQCQGVFLDGPLYCSMADGGLCKPIKHDQSLPHDRCDSNADCKSGRCDDESCVGAGAGQQCNTTVDCRPEYVCDIASATCIARVRNGNAPSSGPTCHDLEVPNGEPTCRDRTRVCENTTTGWQCLLTFDSGPGTPCIHPESCRGNLACLNGTCQRPPDASLATEGLPCSPANASLCGDGMECVCNRLQGSGFCRPAVSYCTSQWRSYWSCISPNNANCHPLTDPHLVNSCVRRRCWGQYKRLLACELSGLTCANGSGERGVGFLVSLMRAAGAYVVSLLLPSW